LNEQYILFALFFPKQKKISEKFS